jgi:tetratricopeptide (TPR) repeat protein
MFGRTERLLSRGQRALSRGDHAAAEASFGAAIARTPRNPHLHLYLAHALAEQERLAEADRALGVAIRLAPASFVFPLHRGILRLDADDVTGARDALAAAASLAPHNRLVAGYIELTRWVESEGAPSTRLVELAAELGESFGARALLHLARVMLGTRGPRAALAVLEPPAEQLGLPFRLWLGTLRHRDRVRYTETLLDRERFDDAASVLTAHPEVLRDPRAPALLERARRGALQAVDAALASGRRAARAALLLQRYEIEHELGDDAAVRATLGEWHELYLAAGAPSGQRQLAAAVMRRLAAVEVAGGRYREALALCAASRAARRERETAGVEALARLGLGERRAARHAFEAFLENALFRVGLRLAAAIATSAA